MSATPVNNRFRDLQNQLALAYEGNDDDWTKKLGLTTDIDTVFRNAQKAYGAWSKLDPEATAEGCIGILMAERSRTLWGSSILLTGFGPVGQALGVRLGALGAQVTAAARRPAQRALAESFGLRSVAIGRLGQLAPAFDTVVNTVPAQVLSAEVLARLRPESLIVDLASRPGGTDFEAARRLGHRAIHALSLPAACAPETAGEAVAQTVCEMIGQREEA